MTRLIAASLLFMLGPLCAQAQQVAEPRALPPEKATEGEDMVVRHVTGWLSTLPESRAALNEFRLRRAAGLLTKGQKRMGNIGDRKDFKVYNIESGRREDIEFELTEIDVADPPEFQIWLEVAELSSGRVTHAVLDSLVQGMGHRTPPRSWNPEAGIIANDEVIFGEPPDVDGDGVTDILLLDIRDGWNGTSVTSFVAGFVISSDLSSTVGNGADIVYLDTYPGLGPDRGPSFLEGTAAHEYQHLIMFNSDLEEITFIDEGLSEWAELALGYASRPLSYLGKPEDYNVSLLMFNEEDSFSDLERGQLFINYIADQFGVLNAGKITRSALHGAPGLRDAMVNMQAGISLEELIFDFHVANGVNDKNIDPRFGYTTPVRNGLRAKPGPVIDGRFQSETLVARDTLQEGGVRYIQWESVEDFALTLAPAASDQDPTPRADNLRAEVFLYGEDGSFVRSSPVGTAGDSAEFEGFFNRVLLVLVNVDPTQGPGAVDYAASWKESSAPEDTIVTVQYDTGQTTRGKLFNASAGAEGLTVTRFVNPGPEMDTQLDRVWVSHYYISHFAPADEGAPRDFALQVWGPGAGEHPGAVLFRQELTDTRIFMPPTLTLEHMEIDLSPFASDIGPLPDTLFIGIGEAGQDENYQVITPSVYPVENHSFIYDTILQDWVPLWDVQFECISEPCPPDDPLRGMVIPTRAQFLVRTVTAVEGVGDVPEFVWLGQNFPNPFNPSTRITYRLPQAGKVRLDVFDLLGRRVAELVESVQAAGEHNVSVDGARWASGVYIYRLETEFGTLTNRMLLLK